MTFHYLDGKWVTEKEMKISVFDLSVIRGYGIFDFLRTYNNQPFRLEDHIARLFNSAKILGMTIPKTKEEIKKIVILGLKKNSFPEAAIKIIVTGGVSLDGISPGDPSFIVMFTKTPTYPTTNYSKGVKITTYDYLRFLPQAKSLNYFTAVYAMQAAAKEKAVEVLYVDDKGVIQECTRSNIFFVKNTTLYTPPEASILKGVTRRIIFDIAKKYTLKLVEREIKESEIKNFSECFITGSTIEVLPVVKINKTIVGNGKVGKVTKDVMNFFRDIAYSS